jgi:PAT family beta-lactamase induction signal transducer AmpG
MLDARPGLDVANERPLASAMTGHEAGQEKASWLETMRLLMDRRILAMGFLGFSAGIPILLIFSSLGIWLREAGIDRSTVTMFSWAALGYSFKFVWAPLVDRLPVPLLTRALGRRRSWILTAQIAIFVAIVWMGSTNPASGEGTLLAMAFAAVLLGFSSATQDIVIDAYRIEAAHVDLQALMSATYIAGYRVGMIAAGAGVLFLADAFASSIANYNYAAWRNSYYIMAALMLIGMATTLLISEPSVNRDADVAYATRDYAGFFFLFLLSVIVFVAVFWFTAGNFKVSVGGALHSLAGKGLGGFLTETLRFAMAVVGVFLVVRGIMALRLVNGAMFREAYVAPIGEFFSRYSLALGILLISLVGLYRISDIVLGVIANVFYVEMGYSKSEIASIVKTFGLVMTIAGGFVGGIISLRFGVMRSLFLGALLTILTNLLFILLAKAGHNIPLLYLVISADNLTAGLASAAFIAFLSSLTNVKFTAVQYAIFSSLMTLIPKIVGGYSGTIVDAAGYVNFFIISSAMGIPILILVALAGRWLDTGETAKVVEE